MNDLRERFGRLLAAHRKRRGMTQGALAEAAELSPDMISKLETGATGARFSVIERLAAVLDIDPAELFSSEIPDGALSRSSITKLTAEFAALSESELEWAAELLNVALGRPTSNQKEEVRQATAVSNIKPGNPPKNKKIPA